MELQIDGGFREKYSVDDWSIEKKFKSKRNDVYLITASTIPGGDRLFKNIFCSIKEQNRIMFILKQFDREELLLKEVKYLQDFSVKDIYVPALYYYKDKQLYLEYIAGKTMLQKIEIAEEKNIEPSKLTKLLAQFVSWLDSFYLKTGLTIGDVNLRNFLVSHTTGKVYGIDFEDVKEGAIEQDIGKICAFILTYRPEFTPWKKELIKLFLKIIKERVDVDIDLIKNEFIAELKSISIRRNFSF